jgi:16S rRNA G966 N2-methylase RsmD
MKVTDKITITNEDNMLLIARYPDNYFDLAIVDPPYGINATKKMAVNKKKVTTLKNGLGVSGIMKHHHKNILMNYLEFLKIKLYGVAITLIYHLQDVFIFGIKNKE